MPRHTGDAPGMRPDASLSYKNATMKHLRIMACLLLLGCMVPATALCAGEDAQIEHSAPFGTLQAGGDAHDFATFAKL